MIDPYAVQCPACLAMPGQRCSNHIRHLDSVHWSRHWVARQRRDHRTWNHVDDQRVGAAGRGSRGRSG
jgi:hypothetical protein